MFVSACSTQSYHHESTDSFPIRERAVSQNDGDIRISASVPDADEAKAIFGKKVRTPNSWGQFNQIVTIECYNQLHTKT